VSEILTGRESVTRVTKKMKKQSIKAHLTPYSIFQKRKTTINHAFASAIAPGAEYDVVKLDAAIRLLGQDPDGDLKCVYCNGDASTWDHLVGLVAKGEFRGNGHQIGNLVPCCGPCNSKKGAKDWKVHLRSEIPEPGFEDRRKVISDYAGKYALVADPERAAKLRNADWKRYNEIREQIFGLMKEADKIAGDIRAAILPPEQQGHNIEVRV
jgi:hypothetical protein